MELIEELNQKYKSLSPEGRLQQLYLDFDQDQVMVTSSFAATSALLLNIVHKVRPQQTIHFIDTGYHFEETMMYKNVLTQQLDLEVESVQAESWKHEFTDRDETWKKDPDLCCSINKVEPLEYLKQNHNVWVSGLMKWQSDHRATLDVFEERNGILKFYPLLDITQEKRSEMIKESQVPFHPLIAQGYSSIGCKHCTVPGSDRSGRWNNNPKTECGLHL